MTQILNVMKTFLLVICIAISINLNAQVTRNEAINIVVDELISPYTLDQKWLFSKYAMMYFNDTIWLEASAVYYLCPFEENWVFFIDDLPAAFWAHECRIVFLNKETGDYEIVEEEWPPEPYLTNQIEFLIAWEWIMSIGIKENPSITKNSTFNIYPNPTVNSIKIEFEPIIKVNFHYRIIDSFGITRLSGSINKQSSLYEINLQNLNNGLYYLYILRNNSIIESKKIIKSS